MLLLMQDSAADLKFDSRTDNIFAMNSKIQNPITLAVKEDSFRLVFLSLRKWEVCIWTVNLDFLVRHVSLP